jgi:hypothetical protein
MSKLWYHLCPKCARAVPSGANEKYCPNDGEKMLECCPACEAKILSPYARHCTSCGLEFRHARAKAHGFEQTDGSVTGA